MKVFLKMKAWQLFVLLFGSHVLMMAAGRIGGVPRQFFTIISIVFLVVFNAWFWSLGTNLNRKVPDEIRPKTTFFRLGIAYSATYMLFSVFFSVKHGSGLYALIIPFQLFVIICMFYVLYFVAKNFVMAERKEVVGFYEFAGPFFLMWLYPVGVWFIQPKVNQMFQEEENT